MTQNKTKQTGKRTVEAFNLKIVINPGEVSGHLDVRDVACHIRKGKFLLKILTKET